MTKKSNQPKVDFIAQPKVGRSTTFRIVKTLHDAEIPQPPPKMNTKIREKDIFEGVSGASNKKKEKKTSKKGTRKSSK